MGLSKEGASLVALISQRFKFGLHWLHSPLPKLGTPLNMNGCNMKKSTPFFFNPENQWKSSEPSSSMTDNQGYIGYHFPTWLVGTYLVPGYLPHQTFGGNFLRMWPTLQPSRPGRMPSGFGKHVSVKKHTNNGIVVFRIPWKQRVINVTSENLFKSPQTDDLVICF